MDWSASGKCDAAECQHGYGECGSGQYGCDGETLGDVASVCCAGCLVWIFGVIFGVILGGLVIGDALVGGAMSSFSLRNSLRMAQVATAAATIAATVINKSNPMCFEPRIAS